MKKIFTFKRFLFLAALLAVLTGCGTAGPDSGHGEPDAEETPARGQPEPGDAGSDSGLGEAGTNPEPEDAHADSEPGDTGTDPAPGEETDDSVQNGVQEQETLTDPEGMTLETRVRVPEGFVRTKEADESLAGFLRSYPMEADGAPVLLYDGSKKGNQSAHAAVFALPVENRDLQQCADSVMRMYAEYFWQTGQYERIAFHFTNGFLAEYVRWRDGNRISVSGNTVSWTASAGYDDSYECFLEYMQVVFTYAGTMSMDSEAAPVGLSDIQAGDVFLHGGSPGHVVMVVDVCEDDSGNKAFLLGQGYMPAQQFHLLKNPAHADDPWYYASGLEYPLCTPEYTFYEGSLKRPEY